MADPERQLLRGRHGQEGVGLRLDCRRLTAAVMQEGYKVVGHRQTLRMGHRLGEGQRLLTPPHGLRRSAQTPQCVGYHC